ncbi:hypothetical protein L0F63_004913, partial [Massospora cicadina]
MKMVIMTRSKAREAYQLQLQEANRALHLIRSALLCPCCQKSLSRPTTLSCGHTMCLQCLPTGISITCPVAGCGQLHFDRHPKLDVTLSKTLVAFEHVPSSENISEFVLRELECQLCYMVFLDPITTSCGHTTCKQCLLRSLDYSDKCPACRWKLPSYRYFSHHPSNLTLTFIITQLFPHLIAQRRESLYQEMPCYLHVFESRYRLMIRRCLESQRRRFGMVLRSNHGVGFHEYGTMVEVRDVEMLQDGRYMINAIGSYRFRILERGIRDGYNIGRVERIEDDELMADSRSSSPNAEVGSYLSNCNPDDGLTVPQLQAECISFIEALKSSSAPWLYQRLNATVGPMPSEPSDLSFWISLYSSDQRAREVCHPPRRLDPGAPPDGPSLDIRHQKSLVVRAHLCYDVNRLRPLPALSYLFLPFSAI